MMEIYSTPKRSQKKSLALNLHEAEMGKSAINCIVRSSYVFIK